MKRALFLSLYFVGIFALSPLAAQNTWSQGNQELSTRFFLAAKEPKENLMFSPLSLQLCLAMAGELATGETQQEILQGISLPEDDGVRRMGASELLAHIDSPQNPKGEAPRFFMANSAWATSSMEMPEGINEILLPYYQAEIYQRDFAEEPDAACQEINTWVEDRTVGKIKNLLPKGSINRSTSLVLVNTLYFKAPWQSPFSPYSTYEGPFYGADGALQSVSYMHQVGMYAMRDTGRYVALELPFRGSSPEISLFIVCPKEGTLEDLASEITPKALTKWMRGLEYKAIDLTLPKFKISSSLNAKNIFQKMGMKRPFSPSEAEFTFAGREGRVFISDIVHQAVFEIDEEGGTGAAATGIIFTTKCFLEPKERVVIDRPFLMFVVDRTHDLILFTGSVYKPEKS